MIPKRRLPRLFVPLLAVLGVSSWVDAVSSTVDGGEERPRVIVSTDIGGTDFDDFQSLVHLLLYADELEIEGLISSPYGPGRKDDILSVIDHYEEDFPKLRSWSDRYPTPDVLRSVIKQGETEVAPYAGVLHSTEGSDWIVECARRSDSRPLHVLVWGGLEDVAQALHDAPDILPKLRVHYIGGPNKKWSPDAYHYIASEHPTLWIIESNSTYRGWFVGGDQEGELSARQFADVHADGHGALGDFFAGGISFRGEVRKEVKMGDTPTVAWLLRGDPEKPYQGGWGGRFVRAWTRPYSRFERLTAAADEIEFCAIMELALPLGSDAPKAPTLRMKVENQSLVGHVPGDGTVRFRFCPKTPKTFSYEIVGNDPSLDGKRGQVTAVLPSPEAALEPDERWPNWWTDDPAPALAEGDHHGAKTVSQWRDAFMRDFARKLDRTQDELAMAEPLRWSRSVLDFDDAWYGSDRAKEVADSVLFYQSPQGGWPKSTDLARPPQSEEDIPQPGSGRSNTFDNDATTVPMAFLARVASATGERRYVDSFLRGLQYIFDAQYENGGWPQFWPLREGHYSRHVTYNDGGMVRIMEMLDDVARARSPYGFVNAAYREQARRSLNRGIDCILKTQIRQNGKLVGWCAQHDAVTLKPAWARAYEPPSLSGGESVGIVRFLMSIEDPSEEVRAAIEGAVAWFREVEIKGVRIESARREDGRLERWLVEDPQARGLWARFYELETNRPLYLDRDSVFRYDFSEIGYERRSGYSYHGSWPAKLLEAEYPRWEKRIQR